MDATDIAFAMVGWGLGLEINFCRRPAEVPHRVSGTVRGILAYNDRSNLFLVSSTNRSSCTFHDDTYRQHKHKKNHLTMAQLPPTVYPAAFGHNSISKRPIDTIFEERVVHKGCDDLVQYGRHRQSNRYRILPTTLEDCLAVTALK